MAPGDDPTGPRREWSIRQLTAATGTTSRTLRHYQQVELLRPHRVDHAGMRFYNAEAVLRLQRILLLRELGMPLAEIREALDAEPADHAPALRAHLRRLEGEQERLARMSRAVRATIDRLEHQEDIMTPAIFDGFDHTAHREETARRWGREAEQASTAWWEGLDEADRRRFRSELPAIVAAVDAATAQGLSADSPEVQDAIGRLHRWVAEAWGGTAPGAEAFRGLGELYVADPRFRASFRHEGRDLAPVVREGMEVYARERLA